MPLESTIYRLDNEKPVDPERVLMLNTIPLNEKRFIRERRTRLFYRKSDFLRTQFPSILPWSDYEKLVVLPILSELAEIKKHTRISIDYDVNYSDFRRAMRSSNFDSIFILAHHIEQSGHVEFAGARIKLGNMSKFLQKTMQSSSKNLQVFICKAGGLENGIFDSVERKGAFSVSYWRMPVMESYRFVKYWLLSLDGKATLSEAYTQAIRRSVNELN